MFLNNPVFYCITYQFSHILAIRFAQYIFTVIHYRVLAEVHLIYDPPAPVLFLLVPTGQSALSVIAGSVADAAHVGKWT